MGRRWAALLEPPTRRMGSRSLLGRDLMLGLIRWLELGISAISAAPVAALPDCHWKLNLFLLFVSVSAPAPHFPHSHYVCVSRATVFA